MTKVTYSQPRTSIRLPLYCGFVSVMLLIFLLGGWGVFARLSGAVIASGAVEVEARSQVVQHPDGGVVAKIYVRNGEKVHAGDVLIELDGTFMQSELGAVRTQLLESEILKLRLEAERDGASTFHGNLDQATTWGDDETATQLYLAQKDVFEARSETARVFMLGIETQSNQLRGRIVALEDELSSLGQEFDLISAQYDDTLQLRNQGLVRETELRDLKRAMIQASSRMRQLRHSVRELEQELDGLSLSGQEFVAQRQQDVLSELSELGYRLSTLNESERALSARIERLKIRAPSDGEVIGSTIHTVLAVVGAGEPIMHIVPSDQPFVILAEVGATDRDALFIGQHAKLMFHSLDAAETPPIQGRVSSISAHANQDPSTRRSFYMVEIAPDDSALDAIPGSGIVPGMPVEAYIATTSQSPLAYLTKPLMIYFQRAMRE